jgi:radical SAM superfamily enzyme YgiQ (UPF0313 family)
LEQILLLNPPGDKLYQRDMYCSGVSKANYYWPSIDLLVLSGILGQRYDVTILDAIVEGLTPEETRRRVEQGEYRAIVFLTGVASWKQDFAFMAGIRETSHPGLIIGNGDVLLYDAERFLREYGFLDAVLFDYTSLDILAFLSDEYDGISAMAFRRGGDILLRKNDIRPVEFAFPVPHHEKFPLKKYLLAHGRRFPFTTAMTNFGCPFNCSFCPASVLGFKYRAVENIMEELRHIASLGIKEIFFTDFTFESRRENTLELCRRIVEEKLDISWVCSSRANTLDEELLSWMKKAGCHTLLLGVENGDEELLQRYSKGVTKDQLRRAFALCQKFRIRTLGHFIIGLPGETEETVRKTIDFAKELDCDIASFNIAVPALGTPLREAALKNGWLQEDVLEFDASDTYPTLETPEFSRCQAWEWRNRAVREFYFRPSYIWKMAASTRSLNQWKILVLNGWAVLKGSLAKGKPG